MRSGGLGSGDRKVLLNLQSKGLALRLFTVLGLGFRGLGFRDFGLRVLGFGVLGFRV